MTLLVCGVAFADSAPADKLVFVCRADNDLYVVLGQTLKQEPLRVERPADAIRQAPPGGGVLILADGYPQTATALDAEMLAAAAKKKLRLYVEFPAWLPGQAIGKPTRAPGWEKGVELTRAVVASDAFGPELPARRILSICGTWYVPAKAESTHLVLARVVGFDSAVLGIPKEAIPLLFELDAKDGIGPVLVSTSKLSQFKTGRYAPAEAWQKVWAMILGWVSPGASLPPLAWTPDVHPTFTRDEKLPEDAFRQAVVRGADHYLQARFLIHPSWQDRAELQASHASNIGPAPTPDMPCGDGSLGLLEGFNSTIDDRGYQPVRYMMRADCNSEAAMALALRGTIGNDPRSKTVAANLLDYVYLHSDLQQGPRADATNPAYGLLGWYSLPKGTVVYYGDDNARALLGTLATAAALKSTRWDEPALRCILANFRTTGRLGFRLARIEQHDLQARGWKHFFDGSPTHYAPHFQAYLWACYIWLYDKTDYQPLLDRTKEGIRRMMAEYPSGWHWTNGMQQERARMLLPLAWLVRVEDTAEHRQWLDQMVLDVLKNQVASGAIREEIGEAGKGAYGPPKTNHAYGTGEATLIQKNGDPVCDLLYTSNFALLGLHEAAAATGDVHMKESAARLAEFLCRIQARSQRHPELEGVWYRAFDYGRWDYWASNSDLGWGAWCTESGWTQGWITGMLGMRLMNTSLWDLTADSQIGDSMEKVRKQMLRDE